MKENQEFNEIAKLLNKIRKVFVNIYGAEYLNTFNKALKNYFESNSEKACEDIISQLDYLRYESDCKDNFKDWINLTLKVKIPNNIADGKLLTKSDKSFINSLVNSGFSYKQAFINPRFNKN